MSSVEPPYSLESLAAAINDNHARITLLEAENTALQETVDGLESTISTLLNNIKVLLMTDIKDSGKKPGPVFSLQEMIDELEKPLRKFTNAAGEEKYGYSGKIAVRENGKIVYEHPESYTHNRLLTLIAYANGANIHSDEFIKTEDELE
jgi:hypothetical protein